MAGNPTVITSYRELETYINAGQVQEKTVSSFQEFISAVNSNNSGIIKGIPFGTYSLVDNNCSAPQTNSWIYFISPTDKIEAIKQNMTNSAKYKHIENYKKEITIILKKKFADNNSNFRKFITQVAMGNRVCDARKTPEQAANIGGTSTGKWWEIGKWFNAWTYSSAEMKFGSRTRLGDDRSDTKFYIKEAIKFLTQYITGKNDYSFSAIYNTIAVNKNGQTDFVEALNNSLKRDSQGWGFVVIPQFDNYSTVDILADMLTKAGDNLADWVDGYLETSGNYYTWSYEEMTKRLTGAAIEIMTEEWAKGFSNQALINCCFEKFLLDNTVRKFTTEVVNNRTYNRMSFAEDDIRIAMRDSSNNIFYASDYTWSFNNANLASYGLQPDDFQTITIYEFQPDRQVAWKTIIDGVTQFASQNNFAQTLTQITQSASGLIAAGAEGIVKKILANDSQGQTKGTNVKWVNDVMKGKWVGQYQIPFFSDDFMKAWSAENWSMGNAFEGKDLLVNNLTANVQDIPTWKFEQGSPLTWKYNFFLINDNISSLRNNLKFLMSFISGAYWFQDSSFSYRSPNLYRIICPGRFIQLYTALNIEVSYVGKIKKYNKNDASMIFGNSDPRFTRFLTDEGACNIPEAYKINLMVQDLTPQAFNINANYFTDAKSELVPNIAVNMKGTSLRNIDKDLEEVKNNAQKLGETTYNKIKGLFGA